MALLPCRNCRVFIPAHGWHFLRQAPQAEASSEYSRAGGCGCLFFFLSFSFLSLLMFRSHNRRILLILVLVRAGASYLSFCAEVLLWSMFFFCTLIHVPISFSPPTSAFLLFISVLSIKKPHTCHSSLFTTHINYACPCGLMSHPMKKDISQWSTDAPQVT